MKFNRSNSNYPSSQASYLITVLSYFFGERAVELAIVPSVLTESAVVLAYSSFEG